jgi:hypothetical protein
LVLRFEATSAAQLNVIRAIVEEELLEAKRAVGC